MQPNQTINPLVISGIYVALLTQTGTNDPTVTVLHNTLGQTLTWTREVAGSYYATTDEDCFTADKTTIQVTAAYAKTIMTGTRTDTKNINITVQLQNATTQEFERKDDKLYKQQITITVYK